MTATLSIAGSTRKDLFETTECSRCGGSGRYSWCSMHGDRCFGCGGSGIQFTKNGQKALDAWRAAYTKTAPVSSIVPGDKVVEIIGGKRVVKTVTESYHETDLNDGRYWRLRYDTGGHPGNLGGRGVFVDDEVELPVTAEDKQTAYDSIRHLKGAIHGKATV